MNYKVNMQPIMGDMSAFTGGMPQFPGLQPGALPSGYPAVPAGYPPPPGLPLLGGGLPEGMAQQPAMTQEQWMMLAQMQAAQAAQQQASTLGDQWMQGMGTDLNSGVGLVPNSGGGYDPNGGGLSGLLQAQDHQQEAAAAPPPPPVQNSRKADDRREAQARAANADQRRAQAMNQAESREKRAEAEKSKCHLHKKVNGKCKFCKKYKELIDALEGAQEPVKVEARDGGRPKRKLDRAISEDGDAELGPVQITNTKTYGFSGLLQTHITECAHFKSLLTLDTFEQVVEETFQFANGAEPYMANSGTLPSALFCCLYRFFTLGLDGEKLKALLENQQSPYLRCAGILYCRFGLSHDQLWNWMGEYVLDDEEFKPSPESESKNTIGEYVEAVLNQDKYYNTVLPRLPMSTVRKLQEKLAPVGQWRKRTQANKRIIQVYRESGTRVECYIGTDWLEGTIMELDEDVPSRPKVRCRMEDGSEEYIHLGKVILTEARGRSRDRGRGRNIDTTRSRSPNSQQDWSRQKGRSDKELVEEMRSRERDRAVCSSGKDYARKPLGYKAACALPREQGNASYKLMEEETFVPMSRPNRQRTPSPERMRPERQSVEHQARMQQLFEKYGSAKASNSGEAGRSDEVDRPDVMRLG